ncbi:MAG: hypothetical protein J5796_03255 [Erysipelotrichaceae bacterium]|nr:hypothetical protein [Erysipelotrichaceae bacterium]
MRRRGGFGFFSLIMMIIMLDIFGSIAGAAFDLLELFIPLGVMAIVFASFFKLFQYLFRLGSNVSQNMTGSYSRKSDRAKSNVKNAKNAKIDKVLAKYFADNVSLILFDDVSISTQSGTYTTVDNLYVNYKEEKVCKLSELKNYYPGAYDKIINALSELAKAGGKVEEEKKTDKKEQKEGKKKDLSVAEGFIETINTLNQGLSNEEVTNGLYQTCDLLKQIDVVDSEDGEIDPKLNKLYEYYLPILTGILEDYKRLSDSPVKGDDFKKCETQLVKTVKLINEALKTIYNSLHESDYMNLNADINTLQSLLKQDGLVEAPFKGEK